MPYLKLLGDNSGNVTSAARSIYASLSKREIRETGITPRIIQDTLNSWNEAIDRHVREYEAEERGLEAMRKTIYGAAKTREAIDYLTELGYFID